MAQSNKESLSTQCHVEHAGYYLDVQEIPIATSLAGTKVERSSLLDIMYDYTAQVNNAVKDNEQAIYCRDNELHVQMIQTLSIFKKFSHTQHKTTDITHTPITIYRSLKVFNRSTRLQLLKHTQNTHRRAAEDNKSTC